MQNIPVQLVVFNLILSSHLTSPPSFSLLSSYITVEGVKTDCGALEESDWCCLLHLQGQSISRL